jgi:NADP-dependent 3-hydroxy acid dehydrogenase YdfG
MSQTPTRTAIVTGASAGIGLAISRRLIESGFRVVLNARREDRLRELCAEFNTSTKAIRATFAAGDCAEQNVIDAMFQAARRDFASDVDAVVINAGRGLAGSVITSDPAQWEEMIRTNLLGAARLMRTAGERMLSSIEAAKSDWRSTPRDIVVVGSIVGRHVSPFSSMYGGTKFGLHGMTEGVRRELAPKGIRVTLVEPGFVVSEFQGVAGYKPEWFQGVLDKIGPVLDPDDVARPIAFLLQQPAHVHISDFIVRPTRQDYP